MRKKSWYTRLFFSSPSSPLLLLYPTGLCKPFSNRPRLSLGPLWMWALFSVSIVWADLSLLLHLPFFWSVWYAYLFTEAWVLTQSSVLGMDEVLEDESSGGWERNGEEQLGSKMDVLLCVWTIRRWPLGNGEEIFLCNTRKQKLIIFSEGRFFSRALPYLKVLAKHDFKLIWKVCF